MAPKISVITPSFNQGKYIKDTIESVLAQRYENFEHIVIDGGSTDETVAILKKYPHLQWISEKDAGQSDALNKGFAKATGDIIAWINSDDWYPEGTFQAVVEALEDYPVVMGSCAIVNEVGKEQYEVPNTERTWFDLLRYWVPYSIPTQPAVFFRRSVLKGLEGPTGEIFDRDLNYTMDYDLWIRLAIRNPLLKRIERRLAFYRMTDSNKTGDAQGGMAQAEPEMARVFRRAETIALSPVVTYSIVIPVEQVDAALSRTVESVLLQHSQESEILLASRALNSDRLKQLKGFITEKNTEQNKLHRDTYLRLVETSHSDLVSAFGAAVDSSEARHIVAIEPGTILGATFLVEVLRAFNSNRCGIVLPWKHIHSIFQEFVPPGVERPAGTVDFIPSKIFESSALPFLFAARRVALLELSELFRNESPQKIIREIIATILFKGWHATIEADARVTPVAPPAIDTSYLNVKRQQMAAEIILELDKRLHEDPFGRERARHGCTFVFEPDVIQSCKNILGIA